MSNGLSQAEIDALLNGGGESKDPPPNEDGGNMTPEEIAALVGNAAEPEPADDNHVMSPDEIAALVSGMPEEPATDADSNHVMTPDEIAALIDTPADSAADPPPADSPAPPAPRADGQTPDLTLDVDDILSPEEKDAMGEVGNISMGSAATTLFSLLNHRVDITTPVVSVSTMAKLADQYPMPFVSVLVEYTVGLEGSNCLFLREDDVKIMTDLMLGGDGSNIGDDLNEMHLSCISEVMNQMVGASSTSMSQILKKPIDISPPVATQIRLAENLPTFPDINEAVVKTSFNMVVEGLIDSEIMQITPVPFAKEMIQKLLQNMKEESTAAPAATPPSRSAPPQAAAPPPPSSGYTPVAYSAEAAAAAAAPMQQAPPLGVPIPPQGGDPNMQQPPPGYPPYPYPPQGYPPPGYPPPGYPPPQQNVQSAQFQSFGTPGGLEANPENIDVLMDVPLSVSVELGKSSKYIREILDFNVGTIVILDKLAGDHVDIVVNGKLIAQGEVVVIDENYGCRITDIISPSKRLK